MKEYLQKHNKDKYTNNWSTPKELYNRFIEKGFIDPNPLNSMINPDTYDNNNKLFINPPYQQGIINKFVDMAIRNHKKYNKDVVLLIPARTDTKYFQELMKYGCDLYFIKGRLKFGDSKDSAPFPSVIIYLTGDNVKYCHSVSVSNLVEYII